VRGLSSSPPQEVRGLSSSPPQEVRGLSSSPPQEVRGLSSSPPQEVRGFHLRFNFSTSLPQSAPCSWAWQDGCLASSPPLLGAEDTPQEVRGLLSRPYFPLQAVRGLHLAPPQAVRVTMPLPASYSTTSLDSPLVGSGIVPPKIPSSMKAEFSKLDIGSYYAQSYCFSSTIPLISRVNSQVVRLTLHIERKSPNLTSEIGSSILGVKFLKTIYKRPGILTTVTGTRHFTQSLITDSRVSPDNDTVGPRGRQKLSNSVSNYQLARMKDILIPGINFPT